MLQEFEKRTRNQDGTYIPGWVSHLWRMDGTGVRRHRVPYRAVEETMLLSICKEMGATEEFVQAEKGLLDLCIKTRGKVPYKHTFPTESPQQTEVRRMMMNRMIMENLRFQAKIALHRSGVGFGRTMLALHHILQQFDWWLVYYGEDNSNLRNDLRKVIGCLMNHPKYGHGT